MTSGDGSRESQTPDYASPTISEAAFGCESTQIHPPMSLPPPRESSERELYHDAFYIIEGLMDPGGNEAAQCFLHASDQPPITPESLAELDMPRIINNPKLRHDVNFDRELHFRPNLDGSKGRQKLRLAEEYWKALEGELFLLGLVHKQRRDLQQPQNEAYWQGILASSQIRLPKLFHAIRDILKTLVPDCDQKSIGERLDVDLIMQEVQKGVCDLFDLGNWLAKVLKNHCAPMRDHMVDSMQMEVTQGASEEKTGRLVNGIRQLLNILEAMKLDVANHQIRHMRPLLVEDTINFQRRYNAHRIAMNKIDVPRSRSWLEYELDHLMSATNSTRNRFYGTKSPSHLQALTSALLKGILFNESSALYPQTFYLDADRLRALRLELHSGIYKSICRDVLADMAGVYASTSEFVKAAINFQNSVPAIMGLSSRFEDRLENIAAEIMRIVLTLEGRYPPFDSAFLDIVLQKVETDLRVGSIAFERHAQDVCDRLLPKLQASVEQNIRMTALHLQDRLVPPVPLPVQPFGFGAVCAPALAVPDADPDDDVVRRFTHIIVLHWQVWADLVYTAPPEHDNGYSSFDGSQSPPSSGSSSPMVPVAQAVYAPGRKWLPIAVTVTEVPSGLPTPAPSPAPESQTQHQASTQQGETSSSEHTQIDSEQQQPA